MRNLSDPHFKGAVQVLQDDLKYQMFLTNGTILKRYLNQHLYVKRLCFKFRNELLAEIINEKIHQLQSGGLIDFFEREDKGSINPNRFEHLHYNGPEVLTMDHLKAGFVVWLVTVLFASCIFICEKAGLLVKHLIIRRD